VRAQVSSYELVSPAGLAEALRLLDESPGAYRPLAGGTDLMVLFAAGTLKHRRFVDLWGLDELRGIAVDDRTFTMGALTTYTEVQAHAVLQREFPMLCRAGFETGGVAIQNRGTIGGNIVNASPAADSPPALLAYEAELELLSAKGSRWVPYDTFHTGYKQTLLAPNEIVSRVRLPRVSDPSSRLHYYRKVGPRKAQAISKVCFAGCAEPGGSKVRIAIGGVAPIVPRCYRTERALEGGGADRLEAATRAFAEEIAPIDDVRSSARYRRRVAENLLADFATRL
jgi:CO/xanthine dehydrogenase FAD-binding subunit